MMGIPSTSSRQATPSEFPSQAIPQRSGEPASIDCERSARREEPRSGANVPRIDDEWRRWIAENLLVGNSPESVLEVLKTSGFSAQESQREINLAQQSPYFRGSELLRSRLRKREWILSVYRKINRLHPRSGVIDRRHKLSRDEFLDAYYTTNRPGHHHRDDG